MSTARPCPACAGKVARCKGQVNDMYVLDCLLCGTLYTAELPSQEVTEEYDGYYTDVNLHFPAFIGTSLDRTFASFEPYRRSGRLLDVGFGAGSSMEAAARAGWHVEGVEVSKPAVEHASDLGFSAFHGEIHEAGYPDGHYDVAIASEVLEHVCDPRALLREIARVLRPGGLLWATTPHGRGLSARVLGLEWSNVVPPEHLQLFSRPGLRRLLKSTDFAIVALKADAVNPYEIVQWLKRRSLRNDPDDSRFDRVNSGYAILEKVHSRQALRLAKEGVNAVLSALRIGDGLKVWAERISRDHC